MNNAKVSIIMGIYNCSDTLTDAIESILNQTFSGWKLIMCDDGSTDETYCIALQYKKKYPDKIILIKNKENRGLNYTLNHCLKYVNTEYVARMDGDDISLPTRLEEEIRFLDTHLEYAIVSCPMIYFDQDGDFMIGKCIPKPQKNDYIKGTPFCHAPCMVRTDIMKLVNGYSVSNKLLRVEDYHLWYKIYMAGYQGYNLKKPLYKMRDDRNAVARRKYKYRLNETYVKWRIYKDMKLSSRYILYILKPLVVGLMPNYLYKSLHRKRGKNIYFEM